MLQASWIPTADVEVIIQQDVTVLNEKTSTTSSKLQQPTTDNFNNSNISNSNNNNVNDINDNDNNKNKNNQSENNKQKWRLEQKCSTVYIKQYL